MFSYMFPPHNSHGPSDHMISSRPLIGQTPQPQLPPLDQPPSPFFGGGRWGEPYLIGIGASIRIGRESQCLPYAGYFF